MGTIWLIGVVVLGLWCSYRYGQIEDSYDRTAVAAPFIFGVLLWPFVIAALIVFAPFAGMAALGKRSKKKKESEADNA
jgi:hypothetical protein